MVKIGVLIIGSLYWDYEPPRPGWRAERLDCMHHEHVKAPIRYGRRSKKRGNSYTMVLSQGLNADEFGTAIAIPCGSRELIAEASWLWAAEDQILRRADGPHFGWLWLRGTSGKPGPSPSVRSTRGMD